MLGEGFEWYFTVRIRIRNQPDNDLNDATITVNGEIDFRHLIIVYKFDL